MGRAYENLRFYKNICEIRRLVNKATGSFQKTQIRLISQMNDAARSAKQNIREGYAKDSAGEFAHSIKISRGSLEELEGDVDDCLEDSLITEEDHSKITGLIKRAYFQMANILTHYIN